MFILPTLNTYLLPILYLIIIIWTLDHDNALTVLILCWLYTFAVSYNTILLRPSIFVK